MVSAPKNLCPKCGGTLVLRRFGSYGDDYKLTRRGTVAANRFRRILFEHGGDNDCMVFCEDCGESYSFTIEKTGRIRIEG